MTVVLSLYFSETIDMIIYVLVITISVVCLQEPLICLLGWITQQGLAYQISLQKQR